LDIIADAVARPRALQEGKGFAEVAGDAPLKLVYASDALETGGTLQRRMIEPERTADLGQPGDRAEIDDRAIRNLQLNQSLGDLEASQAGERDVVLQYRSGEPLEAFETAEIRPASGSAAPPHAVSASATTGKRQASCAWPRAP
jgi:hypothetical protein